MAAAGRDEGRSTGEQQPALSASSGSSARDQTAATPICEPPSPSPSTNYCRDRSSYDISVADMEASTKVGETTPEKQQYVLKSVQPGAFSPVAFTTPTNTFTGMEWHDNSGVGSVFVDGKR